MVFVAVTNECLFHNTAAQNDIYVRHQLQARRYAPLRTPPISPTTPFCIHHFVYTALVEIEVYRACYQQYSEQFTS